MGKQRRGGRKHHHRHTRQSQPVLTGVLHIARPGVASVETPEGTFAVARGGIREGMNDDEVQVSVITRGRGGERLAVVRSVLTRATTSFLGTFHQLEPLGAVVPLDARLKRDFYVLPEDHTPAQHAVSDGDVVAARILSYPARGQAGVVTIDRRVGSADELDLDIEAVVASFGLATEFSAAAISEAAACEVDIAQALSSDAPVRRDLRDACTLTVDPADARDFDDAVSAHRLPAGGYAIGVHIADVTHYLRWNSSLDIEARARSCSTYLVDRVLAMLPEHLSNNVCSLRPHEDRLCMSVLMTLDARGRVTSAEVTRSVICSKARLSYDEVDALLADRADAPRVPQVSPELLEALVVLNDVAQLREHVRRERGAVDFSTREAKVLLDADGNPCDVHIRTKTPATSLIEEAMLMANETVAEILDAAGMQSAYRVHEQPTPDDMATAVRVLRALDIVSTKELDALVAGDSQALSSVLDRVAGTADELVANALLLRAQRRAVYEPRNAGHYALGAQAYCHFTSPIRRYPDVMVHRTLKTLLDAIPGGCAHMPAPASSEDLQLSKAQLAALPQLCRNCSDQERVADAAARASQKVKMAQLFAGRIGERAVGSIVGVERFGLFVMLNDTCAEGLVPTRSLGEEWFVLDESRAALVGEASGRSWRLGQRVVVEVVGATPSRGQIDFKIIGMQQQPH